MRSQLLRLLMGFAFLGAALFAHADTTMPAHVRSELSQPVFLGQGAYRWFGLKLYEAHLWSDASERPDRFNTRFALDLRYARTLYGRKIAEASDEQIARLGMGTAAQRQQWLTRMLQLFPDVKEGTHITGVYLPDEGARFYLDGKLLGEVKDPSFARAFFSIWLSENTSAASLRAALLGLKTK